MENLSFRKIIVERELDTLITQLYFVRHAHSTYTPEELERPLSEKGFEDAKKVTEILKDESIDHIVSSPYKRAIQTVEGIAQHIGKGIDLIEAFRERTLSTKPVDDFNKAIASVWEDFDLALEGGESNYTAQARGVEATRQLLHTYRGKKIVIGTHGNIMVLIMNHFDPKFDVRFWEQLEMPDIYCLTFDDTELVHVHRVPSTTRYTIFKAIGIHIDYPLVDIENEQMTGTVLYDNQVYMTVRVDLRANTFGVKGDLRELAHLTEQELNEKEYVEMFQTMARFFIDNNIHDPKSFYEKQIANN